MSTRPASRPATSASAVRPPTAPPRAPLTVDPAAHIADKASIIGTFPVSIAASAVIHPYARLTSTCEPIDIGEGVVIWERAIVGEGTPGREYGVGERKTILARHVIIEAGASIGAGAVIGEGSVVEVGAKVGEGCVIAKVSNAIYCHVYSSCKFEYSNSKQSFFPCVTFFTQFSADNVSALQTYTAVRFTAWDGAASIHYSSG